MTGSVDERLRQIADIGAAHDLSFGAHDVIAATRSAGPAGAAPDSAGSLGQLASRRPVWRRPALAALAFALVLGAVVLVIGVTHRSPSGSPSHRQQTASKPHFPVVDTSLTPNGWAPVAFHDVQISVPGSWLVESGRAAHCEHNDPVVILGRQQDVASCLLTTAIVQMSVPSLSSFGKSAAVRTVNGVRATDWRIHAGFYFEALGVTVYTDSPLGNRILSTLTFSPQAIVLDSQTLRAPANWTRYSSVNSANQGISFKAPGSWRWVHPPEVCAGSDPAPNEVAAVRPLPRGSILPCVARPWTASKDVAHNGVTIGTGPDMRLGLAPSTNCRIIGGIKACLATSQTPGALDLLFAVPQTASSRPPTEWQAIEIGLGGNGIVAKEILDSIGRAKPYS